MRSDMHTHLKRLAAAALVSFFVGAPAFGSAETEANVLNFALSGNPDTLDPQATTGTLTFQVTRSIYDTLIEPDESGSLVPALARTYTVSDDSLTWTFGLRPEVRFHNGDGLTSADVKATFERLVDEKTASPSAAEFRAISSISTPDEHIVIFHLSEPHAPLLSSMASGWGAILPRSLIDSDHDFGSEPVGTGPFSLLEWTRDSRIVLEKNEAYWVRGEPKLDMVVMNIIIERAVAVQALIAGELDAIYNVNAEDVPIIESDPNLSLSRNLTSLVMVMAINNRREPLADINVRRAINHAIDKQAALDVAYGGGHVIGTFMDFGDPYYVDFTDLYPHDPDKARELLEDAHIGDDVVLELALPQNFEPHVRAGELYQEMLENVGLKVEIKLLDWSTWLGEVYGGGNFDLTVIGHTGKLDPDGRLGGYGEPGTYVGWENSDAAGLIESARKTADIAERKNIYSRVLEIMALEVPFVYVGSSYRYVATASNVSGFRMDTKLDTFDFRNTEKH